MGVHILKFYKSWLMELIMEIKSLLYFNSSKNWDFNKKEAIFQRLRTQLGKVNST